MGSGLQKASQHNKSSDNRERVEKSQVILHNSNIPQDIIEDILTRLPVKSVIRFKVVSKLWHSTISDPSFHWRGSATSVFAVSDSYSSSGTRHFYFSINENGSIDKFQVPSWCQLEGKRSRPIISNSCNGMLLLCYDSCIFLLNPTTHYIDKVLTLDEWYDRPTEVAKMGFCYDESISDYKAVIFVTSSIFVTYTDSSLKVASMKEKKWTEFRSHKNFNDMSLGPYVNGRLHSTVHACRSSYGKGEYDHDNTILYFNPVKDMFDEVACPQPKSGKEDAIVGLGVLDDCLCLSRRIGNDRYRGDVEVLKMKEYGVAESWTSLFVIKDLEVNRCHGRMSPLLRTEDGDILLIDVMGRIWRYNLAEKSCTKFILNSNFHRIAAVTFVQNLSSPNRRDVREGYWRKLWLSLK